MSHGEDDLLLLGSVLKKSFGFVACLASLLLLDNAGGAGQNATRCCSMINKMLILILCPDDSQMTCLDHSFPTMDLLMQIGPSDANSNVARARNTMMDTSSNN